MAKYLGNDLLINLNDGGTITPIGGSADDTVTWSAEVVDTTDKSTNRWREITAAGERRASMRLNGFISDDAAFETMRQASKDDTILNYRFVWSNSIIMEALFHVDSFEGTGVYGSAQGFTATLTSAEEPMQGLLASDFLQDETGTNLTSEDNLLLQGAY